MCSVKGVHFPTFLAITHWQASVPYVSSVRISQAGKLQGAAATALSWGRRIVRHWSDDHETWGYLGGRPFEQENLATLE